VEEYKTSVGCVVGGGEGGVGLCSNKKLEKINAIGEWRSDGPGELKEEASDCMPDAQMEEKGPGRRVNLGKSGVGPRVWVREAKWGLSSLRLGWGKKRRGRT